LTDRAVLESELTRIADELRREHEEDAWHGTPLRQILAEVDEIQASWRPFEGVQTIWELVLHMTAWKNEVRRRLGGAPAGVPPEGDWPHPPASPEAQAWRQAVGALEDAQRALVEAVLRVPPSMLLAPTSDPRDRETGQGVSHYILLHGIVQHDVYHSGQIALLRKSFAARA
jgi:uncharacterized damage-inducible protein DinB